jgi:hypothetical protein
MKKLFVSLMLVILVSSFSFAQMNKNWDGTKPEVYQGSKSLVFVYSPFVSNTLGSVPAGFHTNFVDTANANVTNMFGIGFQYYVSPQIALVLGLNFNSQSYTPTFAGQTVSGSSTALGVSIDANYHFKSLYSVSPYLGINANLGTFSQTYDVTTSGGTANYKTTGSGIGFGANLGFDWYFTPGLSLGGKYTVGINLNGAPDNTSTVGGTSTTLTGPKTSVFGTGIASIMLNVHF